MMVGHHPLEPDDPASQSVRGAGAPTAARHLPIAIPGRHPNVNGSFINPLVEVFGDVQIGQRCYISGNTLLLARAGRRVVLGDENNCQDNAYVLATSADLQCGDMVSIAHQAVIEDSLVGAFTFFGFRSRVRRCQIGAGAMIMHSAVVEDVIVASNRFIPIGATITTQAQADRLPEVIAINQRFKQQVQAVNLEFVTGYTNQYHACGIAPLEGVGPNPCTSWNPVPVNPTIGADTQLDVLVRIVGDVRLGANSRVGQRTSIRADEGTPIVIGRHARIRSRVTFHALQGTGIEIGDNCRIGSETVIHGPLRVGDNANISDECVVFQATLEDHVEIHSGATVVGHFTLREGTVVPEGAVITTQDQADALPRR